MFIRSSPSPRSMKTKYFEKIDEDIGFLFIIFEICLVLGNI